MSSEGDADAAAIVAMYDNLYAANYCEVAASVLFLYEAAITLNRDVVYFRTAKRSGASLLFLANKWCSTMIAVFALVNLAPFLQDKVGVPSDTETVLKMTIDMGSCTVIGYVTSALEVLQFIPAAVLTALRAYVLSRRILIGLLILALCASPAGANLVPYGYHMSVVIIARVPLIISDLLLIYITWSKLSSRSSLHEIPQFKRLSLSAILFRDGTIYFLVLFVLNVLHLAFSINQVATPAPGAQGGSYLTIFTAPFSSILISHFLLDLQEANQAIVRVDPDDPLHTSRDPYDDTPSFISSIGGFINPDPLAPSEGDSESQIYSRSDGGEEGGDRASESQLTAQ